MSDPDLPSHLNSHTAFSPLTSNDLLPSVPFPSRSEFTYFRSHDAQSKYHASLPPLPSTPGSRHLSSLMGTQETKTQGIRLREYGAGYADADEEDGEENCFRKPCPMLGERKSSERPVLEGTPSKGPISYHTKAESDRTGDHTTEPGSPSRSSLPKSFLSGKISLSYTSSKHLLSTEITTAQPSLPHNENSHTDDLVLSAIDIFPPARTHVRTQSVSQEPQTPRRRAISSYALSLGLTGTTVGGGRATPRGLVLGPRSGLTSEVAPGVISSDMESGAVEQKVNEVNVRGVGQIESGSKRHHSRSRSVVVVGSPEPSEERERSNEDLGSGRRGNNALDTGSGQAYVEAKEVDRPEKGITISAIGMASKELQSISSETDQKASLGDIALPPSPELATAADASSTPIVSSPHNDPVLSSSQLPTMKTPSGSISTSETENTPAPTTSSSITITATPRSPNARSDSPSPPPSPSPTPPRLVIDSYTRTPSDSRSGSGSHDSGDEDALMATPGLRKTPGTASRTNRLAHEDLMGRGMGDGTMLSPGPSRVRNGTPRRSPNIGRTPSDRSKTHLSKTLADQSPSMSLLPSGPSGGSNDNIGDATLELRLHPRLPPTPLKVPGNPFDMSLSFSGMDEQHEDDEDLLADQSFSKAMGLRKVGMFGGGGKLDRVKGNANLALSDITIGDLTIGDMSIASHSDDEAESMPMADTREEHTASQQRTPQRKDAQRQRIIGDIGLPLPRSESRKHLSMTSDRVGRENRLGVDDFAIETPNRGLVSKRHDLEQNLGTGERTPAGMAMGMKVTLIRPSDSPTTVLQGSDHPTKASDPTVDQPGEADLTPSRARLRPSTHLSSPASLFTRQDDAHHSTAISPSSHLSVATEQARALQVSTLLPTTRSDPSLQCSQGMLGAVDLGELMTLSGLDESIMGAPHRAIIRGMRLGEPGLQAQETSRKRDGAEKVDLSPTSPVSAAHSTNGATPRTLGRQLNTDTASLLLFPATHGRNRSRCNELALSEANIGDQTLVMSSVFGSHAERDDPGAEAAYDLMHGEMSFMADLNCLADDDEDEGFEHPEASRTPLRSFRSTPVPAILESAHQRVDASPIRERIKHLSSPAPMTPSRSATTRVNAERQQGGIDDAQNDPTLTPAQAAAVRRGALLAKYAASPRMQQPDFEAGANGRVQRTPQRTRPIGALGDMGPPPPIGMMTGLTRAPSGKRTDVTARVEPNRIPAIITKHASLNPSEMIPRTTLLRRAPALSDGPVGSPRALRAPAISDAPTASPRIARTGVQAPTASLAKINLPRSPVKPDNTNASTTKGLARPKAMVGLPRATGMMDRQKMRQGTSPEKVLGQASRCIPARTTARPGSTSTHVSRLASTSSTEAVPTIARQTLVRPGATSRVAPSSSGLLGRTGLPLPQTRKAASTPASATVGSAVPSVSAVARRLAAQRAPIARTSATQAAPGAARRTAAEIMAAIEAKKARR